MLLVAHSSLYAPHFLSKYDGPKGVLHHFTLLDCHSHAKMSSIFSAFSTKTAVVKALFCPFLHVISVSRNAFKPFCTLHILATGLLFAAFYLAFLCILPCILLHFALRFGAFCAVICPILHHDMTQIIVSFQKNNGVSSVTY